VDSASTTVKQEEKNVRLHTIYGRLEGPFGVGKIRVKGNSRVPWGKSGQRRGYKERAE